jgi:hypothetical protein
MDTTAKKAPGERDGAKGQPGGTGSGGADVDALERQAPIK